MLRISLYRNRFEAQCHSEVVPEQVQRHDGRRRALKHAISQDQWSVAKGRRPSIVIEERSMDDNENEATGNKYKCDKRYRSMKSTTAAFNMEEYRV